MTNNEASKVAIWAVSIADKYNMKITKVVEVFKAINEFHRNIEVAKSITEEGFLEAKREGLANE